MLSSSRKQLVEALDLSDVNEEELGHSLLALLATTRQSAPRIPLSRIAHEIAMAGAASLLDPLDTLPILLSCNDPAAAELLLLIGECGPAKEIVIAIQEATERLIDAIDNDDDDDDELHATLRPLPSQLAVLVDLYSVCIPRLKLRRKSTSETLRPLLSELGEVIQLLSSLASREEGRSLINSVSLLVVRLGTWVRSVDGENTNETAKCYKILESVLDCTLIAYERCIHASLAQRTLESFYPRLASRSAIQPDWEAGKEVISDASNAYLSLNISPDSVLSTPSLQRLIVFAHSGIVPVISHLTKLVPAIIGSLQANCGVDESLSILLYALDPLRALPRPYLSEEVIYPLFAAIPPLSSSHPDPLVRHQSFRILSLFLASCPSPLRLQLLRELALDESFPQMRVAAVGLVKEAVLEGLSHPPNLFASPSFFDAFGSILFTPNPPDLLVDQFSSIAKFQESSEPARLVECLGAYYTILQRDKNNLTRMRNADALRGVEACFLNPLRSAVDRLAKEQELAVGHTHDALLLGSLQISLERVDNTISQLKRTD